MPDWTSLLPQPPDPKNWAALPDPAQTMMKIAAFGDAHRTAQMQNNINALRLQNEQQTTADTAQTRNYLQQQQPGVPFTIAQSNQQEQQKAKMQQMTEMFNKSIEAVMSGDSRKKASGMAFLKQIAPGIVPPDLAEEAAPSWAGEVKMLGDKHLPPQQTMQGLQAIRLKYAGDKEAQEGIKAAEENEKVQFGMTKIKGYDTPEEAFGVAQDMASRAGKGYKATYEVGPENKYVPKVVPDVQARANIQVNVAGEKTTAQLEAQGKLFSKWAPEEKEQAFMSNVITGKPPGMTSFGGIGMRAQYAREYNAWQVKQGITPGLAAAMQTDYKAKDKSTGNQRKIYDTMNGFVINMDKQMKRLDDVYKQLPRAQYKLLNVPFVELRRKALGSGEEAQAAMILVELGNEAGKLSTNSASSIRELSESAQKQWGKIHDGTLSYNDLKKVLQTTQGLGHDRLNSTKQAMDATLMSIEDMGQDGTPDYKQPQPGSTGSAKKVGRFTIEVE